MERLGTHTMGNSSGAYICERCGKRMQEIHCKLMCPRCGYTRDCSDP